MTEKTILVLPSGELNINDQLVIYDDKFRYIEDNFKNPNIPETQVIMNNQIIGHAIDYQILEDGMYFKLELNEGIDITNKYPDCKLEDWVNNEGVSYKFYLKQIILEDKPRYAGYHYKELNKLKTKEKDGFTSPSFPESMPERYQDILAGAYASCRKKWVKEHPDDRENKKSKERCARIAWAAVRKAGYSTTKELQMPNPNDYNSEQEWMQVCIPYVMKEGATQEEAKGKCYGMWQNKNTGELLPQQPERKSKIEILNQIKKLIEKNGYAISDEKILEMFGVIQDGKGTLTKLNKTLNISKDTHEIKVFPKKTVYIEKYDEHVKFDDKLFMEMINAFNCPKLFKPYMDEDHALGEKFADIIDLYTKTDGLYAKIQLNEKGKEAIKNNIYSYISPEWGDRTDTEGILHKNVLWAITLTNIPALEGENPKLQDQIKLTKKILRNNTQILKNKLEVKMDNKDLRTNLAKLEGKVSNYKLQDAPMEMPPELMEAIQMIKDAIMKIDELTQQNQEVVEEAARYKKEKEVAEKLAEDAQGKLNDIQMEKEEAEKEEFFEKVVADGKLNPDEVEDYKLMYDKAKEIVVRTLTARKEQNDKQKTTTSLNTENKDEVIVDNKKYKLTQEDYFIIKDRGMDRNKPEDIERYVRDVLVGMEE